MSWCCSYLSSCSCCRVSFPLAPPWLCRFVKMWSSSALCWLSWLGRVCRAVGWKVIISFTLTAQSLLPSQNGLLRFDNAPFSFAPVRRWVVGVVLIGLAGLYAVTLIGAGRGVVVIGNSPSPSLWFASLGCCLCDIKPKWPPSQWHSLSHWLVVGSSALCCVGYLSRVVVMSIGAGRVVVCLHLHNHLHNQPLTTNHQRPPPTTTTTSSMSLSTHTN